MGSNTQNRKNASGNRSDIAWKYGTEVHNNPMKIMCKFCNKKMVGNVSRLKHHLAGTKQNVKACKSVPVEVKTQMAEVLTQLKNSSKRRMRNEEEEGMIESVHKRGKMIKESISNGAIGTTQNIINQNSEKRLRDEACQQIVRFFHTSGIPFSCAQNPEFAKIFELVGKCGSEFVPPSYHELDNSSLEKEMKNTTDMLEKYRYEWKKTGCSIICDEWTDTKGMIYCNFLVNSPTGTIFLKSIDTSDFLETVEKVFQALDEIVEKVGEENVVQVITNNAANYKTAMEMLRQKRKRIVWSPCVIQLLDGILEDFEKNVSYHWRTIAKGKKINTFFYSSTKGIMKLRTSTNGKDLNGLTITPSATAYLNLLYLFDIKVELIRMVSSVDWEKDEFAKTKEGEEIQQIIKDCEFWDDIVDCLNIALPIIEILLKTDSDEKPTITFIHEKMDGAKKSLQSLNNAKGYQSIWKIINERWFALYNPLHAASYFLNPQFHCPSEIDEENVAHATKLLLAYNDDLSMTIENQTKIAYQLKEFFGAGELFGSQAAIISSHTNDPAKWWDSYGKHCPELQRIAIRLLSLTCSSCGTGQIRNAYEQVYPKKRSCLYQKKLNELRSVIQNFKSKTQQARRKIFEGINPEASSSDNESITEKEVVEVSGAKKGMLVRVEVDEDASEEVPLPGNHSGNEMDTRLYNPQPQSASSGVPLPGNHSGNKVDTRLYNPQPQSASLGVPLLGNHSGNEVDTRLYNPQPQSASSDVNEFYDAQCDPDKENVCLYGHSNDMWEVNLLAEEAPPHSWHSDSWILSVAFYLGARLNRNERSSGS